MDSALIDDVQPQHALGMFTFCETRWITLMAAASLRQVRFYRGVGHSPTAWRYSFLRGANGN